MAKTAQAEPDLKVVDDDTVQQPLDADPKPDPKPGDADYDWSQHYGDAELYVHTFPDGKVVALKSFASIFSKTWMYKIRHLKTNIDIEIAALERGGCDAAAEVLDSLDETDECDPVSELWDGWSGKGTSRGEGDEGLTSGN